MYDNHQRVTLSLSRVADILPMFASEPLNPGLRQTLENRMMLAGLDGLILVDPDGKSVLGLHYRADQDHSLLEAGANFGQAAFVQDALSGAESTGLLDAGNGKLLSVAVPVEQDGAIIGAILTGYRLNRVLTDWHRSALTEVSVYDQTGVPLTTTIDNASGASLQIAANIFETANRSERSITQDSNDGVYQALLFPLEYGPKSVALVSIVLQQGVAFDFGQQLSGLLLAALSAAVLVVTFIGLNVFVQRLQHVAGVAEALATGQFTARTNLKPTDEVGVLGKALDAYADYVQSRQDSLRIGLRRQRRETERPDCGAQYLARWCDRTGYGRAGDYDKRPCAATAGRGAFTA